MLEVRGDLEKYLSGSGGDVEVSSLVLELLEGLGEEVEGIPGSVLVVFYALGLEAE